MSLDGSTGNVYERIKTVEPEISGTLKHSCHGLMMYTLKVRTNADTQERCCKLVNLGQKVLVYM